MKKTCAAFLSLSLSTLAALTPAAQAAQFAGEASGIHAVAIPAASLTTSLPALPMLPGSALPTLASPALSQVPDATAAAEAPGQSPAAAGALAAERSAAAPAAAISTEGRLEQAGRALAQNPSQSPEGTLNPLFENAGKRDDCAGSCGSLIERVDDSPAPLQPASVQREAAHPENGAPLPPRSSFKRSAKVGLIGAVAMLAVNFVTAGVASMLGYQFHPGYHDPTPAHLTVGLALTFLTALSVFAPVAEEVMFRYGLMGLVRKMTFNKSKFIVPAVVSSILFTAAHEMHDPVLFGMRFIGAMILARVYHKEGIAASMSTHGIYNGLPFLPVIASLAFGPAIGNLLGMALIPVAGYLAFRFYKEVKAEAPARAAGRIAPFQVTRSMAFGLVMLLTLGFLLVVHTPVWLAGMICWIIYAMRHKPAAAGK